MNTTVTFTFAQMREFIIANSDHDACNAIFEMFDDVNDEQDCIDTIKHYAHSATERVEKYLKLYCRFDVVTDRDSITFDEFYLSCVDALCHLIANEYDTDDYSDRQTDDSVSIWKMLNLHGDDDVDYNSSYLSFIVELMRAMYTAHRKI